jgi:hypothetical protein
MSLSVIIPLFALVVLIGGIIWALSRPKRAAELDPEVEEVDRVREGLLQRFYAATEKGETVREVARIYSQTDVAAVQALMFSEGIPLLPLNTEMNVLRTGVPIRGLNDCVFVVLQKDYETAVQILQDYLQNIAERESATTPSTAIRNVAETVVGGTFVNSSIGRPEIL